MFEKYFSSRFAVLNFYSHRSKMFNQIVLKEIKEIAGFIN